VNSLALVMDDSDMVTFVKAQSQDVFVSAKYEEINGGLTRDQMESFFENSMVASNGGSSISEMYVGTSADTVDEDTGIVTKYDGDKQYLCIVYENQQGKYFMTKVNLNEFIIESEFASGLTVNADGVVYGVVDPRAEKVYTAYDASGNPTTSASVLTVNESGFTVDNIQKAIDEASKKTVRKVAKKAEYVWDSVQQKMVLKLYDEYDVLINGIDFFDTNNLGQILLQNTVF
jgi:hypothetical protein